MSYWVPNALYTYLEGDDFKPNKVQLDKKTRKRSQSRKDRPFECQFCEKSFTQKTVLIRHIMIHTGMR